MKIKYKNEKSRTGKKELTEFDGFCKVMAVGWFKKDGRVKRKKLFV